MKNYLILFLAIYLYLCPQVVAQQRVQKTENSHRQRISINENWKFFKYDSAADADHLIYDVRPGITDRGDDKVADAMPTEAADVRSNEQTLKAWILPSANNFIKNPAQKHVRPEGNPGSDFPFVRKSINDSSWDPVNLPHDWAIKGPFMEGPDAEVGGGMGRLPSHGVAWYRRKLDISESDLGKKVFLEVDGAMSYAMVWLNENLVGGWPYGYNSWQLDLTPYIVPGGENQLAIRVDNPSHSARWYPGGGLYRNVWILKTNPVHVTQWGTFVTTSGVSEQSAAVDLEVTVDNDTQKEVVVEVTSRIFETDFKGNATGNAVAEFLPVHTKINAGSQETLQSSAVLKNPKFWGPPPSQKPNMYKVITTIFTNGEPIDQYETPLGVRTIVFDPKEGLLVNGEKIPIKGVNQHHDLGALGAAFNTRAAERQLEILQEMGCNAIRTAHNPPAPELLELTDRMGFLVVNEIFDVWERKKTPLDFHLIFPDWYEADTRAFIRRDRNYPSVIAWSFGNEVGEQYTGYEGADLAEKLYNIVKEEDATRAATLSVNFAKPGSSIAAVGDIINLNYQGEGIRDAPAYSHLQGIRTKPLYTAFHEAYPDRTIISSETASALSSRGTYLFPVFEGISAPVIDGFGGDPVNQHVNAYELYTAAFGSSADKVFASQDMHPFVAGEFVWTGWDYIGEPTPYYGARSSYSGIIDLAGFKKDRFYLYQSRWRPEFPMAHILPHWNWPERTGEITPVHVFTSGDEAELFLNSTSMGRKKKEKFDYRLRWDDVKYEPGELKVVAYKNGEKWAESEVKTTGKPAMLKAAADRKTIQADGKDLAFITLEITDENGLTVPNAGNLIEFSIEGPGKIVATDNGDPASMISFHSPRRNAFNGLALVIVQSNPDEQGTIAVTAKSSGLKGVSVNINTIHHAYGQLYPNTFPLGDVVLLDGPFKHARDLNIQHLLKYDVDRLLAPYRKEAGLEPKAESYDNWIGLDGHIGGHYLSAMAMNYAATGNPNCKKRMDYMLAEIKACQDANAKNNPEWGVGYVGGVPDSKEIWPAFQKGNLGAFHKSWVPWYNLHKMYAGLRDAWWYGGSEEAKSIFLKFCDWGVQITSGFSDDEMEAMLGTEYGGMNEIYADAFEITGDEKYLTAAKRFSHKFLMEPMVAGRDNLDNLHANTQVPKAIGFQRIAEVSGDETYANAGSFFWETVTKNRSLAFGGNSRREHFPTASACSDYVVDVEGPESCNTNNMLKLTEGLFRENPSVKYADYYERALFNHILSTQHPEHGGYVYFTPARPRHYRVYSAPNQGMWCCVGTGMENHGKYNEFIYTHQNNSLYLNLFVASELSWKEKGVQIRQETNFPFEEKTRLRVTDGSARFNLMIRYPSWVAEGNLKITINGDDFPVTKTPSSYIPVERTWQKGDVVEISFPMQNRLEQMTNVPNYYAFMHGPILLAAKAGTENLAGLVADDSRWGHIAHGERLPVDEAPVIITNDISEITENLEPVQNSPFTWKLSAHKMINAKEIILEPFFQIHDARYSMYWMVLSNSGYRAHLDSIAQVEMEKLELQKRTIDFVATGEQQPEADHAMQTENSNSGNNWDEFYREARNGGFFSYLLATKGEKNLKLMVRYWGYEWGSRKFDIFIDNQKLISEDNTGRWYQSKFHDVIYEIPDSMVEGKESVRVKFQAHKGSTAGAVYYIRLLR